MRGNMKGSHGPWEYFYFRASLITLFSYEISNFLRENELILLEKTKKPLEK